MVESHSGGGAAGSDSDCPDKYVPDETWDIDVDTSRLVHFGTTEHGYRFWSHRHLGEKYHVPVHRLMAVAKWGFDVVKGNIVHHKNGVEWDNRPENLEVKSQSEHIREHFRNGQYGPSKPTAEDVAEMRRDYNGEKAIKEVAEDYPVSYNVVVEAIRGKTWGWVDEPPVSDVYVDTSRKSTKLTEQEVKEIRERYEPYKTSQNDLAEEYNVSSSAIQKIVEGKTWTDVGSK
jgi:hypothetical protein